MSQVSTAAREPAATERRPLPPSRDPDQGIRPGNTPKEGPPLAAADTAGLATYWIVLHCSFEARPQKEKEH